MFCGFLYLFMEKPDNRKRNVICFLLFSTVMFGILLYSSLVEYYMIINDLMFLAVLEIYSLLCLRGNIFSRIFMPLIAFLINTVISFAFSYFVSFFTGYTHYELVTEPTIYRYICIVVINLTDVLVFSMLVKFRNHKVNLRKITDVIAFIILPVIVLLIVYCSISKSFVLASFSLLILDTAYHTIAVTVIIHRHITERYTIILASYLVITIM